MTCAIVIISHKENLTNLEEIALKQCCNVFSKRTIYLIVPESLGINNYTKISKSFKIIRTKDKNLSTYEAFNKYKISLGLYWKFRSYDYILFYEPDAFVFRDDLDQWMLKNYSLIGAPWVEKVEGKIVYKGVGNGGFSLRHVNSHINALLRFSYVQKPNYLWREILNFPDRNYFQKSLSFIKRLTFINNTFFLFNDFQYNEDVFWSTIIPKTNKRFFLPSEKEAMKFSIERFPSELYKINNYELPMGCHAWPKYDLNFWSQFIEFER